MSGFEGRLEPEAMDGTTLGVDITQSLAGATWQLNRI